MKIHYEHGPHGNACGRTGQRSSTSIYAVTCLNCQKSGQFIEAKKVAERVKHERFMSQEPHEVREPWRDGLPMVCSGCGDVLFRDMDRSCFGHYDNWQCANCQHVESRLTETGMSF